MRRSALPLWLTLVVSTLLALTTGGQAQYSPYPPAEALQFDAVLAPLGLTRTDLALPAEAIGLWGGDKYKVNLLDFLRADVTRCGPYARSISSGLLTNKDNLGGLVTAAHTRLDHGIRLGLVGDPLEAYRARIAALGPDCLAVALAELTAQPAATFSGDPAYQALPQRLREAAALVLFTAPEAQVDRQLGLIDPIQARGLDPHGVAHRITAFVIGTFAEEDNLTGHEVVDDRADAMLAETLLDSVDWDYLHCGATLLAIAATEANKILAPPGPAETKESLAGTFAFTADTPLGRVVLRGDTADSDDGRPTLLCIDTGGADTYASAGMATVDHPIGICIDLAGDDSYINSDDNVHTFGTGSFGTGILLDAAGHDTYSSTYAAQGAGIFGTGILYDLGGDDRYSAFGNSQASGTFGTGLLADLDGNDEYHIYKYGQAYGGTRGCGILLDSAGDDRYLANLTDHFNGGLYGPTHHVHFVQGSAYGRRADITDGHSWAGGVGILCDVAGNDYYEADVYGQGNSYWHACGMLIDRGGNDTYRAGQYSQASAPHFAIGILQDDAGDDRYLCSIRQSLGHGRDWSIAWLEDSAGDDWYQGARTTLGCSHVNSISVCWDKLGDDVYIAKGTGLGESEPEPNGSPRDWLLTLGLFIDGAGTDGYYLLPGDDSYEGSSTFTGEISPEGLAALPRLDFAGDGRNWQRTSSPAEAPGYMGSGVDL
jgi:hypothetical protein